MTQKPTYQILIVDDHPLTVESYIALLGELPEHNYHTAYNSRETWTLIQKFDALGIEPDIAFLDVNLPAAPEYHIETGIDIAALLRQKYPRCKILIITMHKEPLWVNRIIKEIHPDGFLSKSETNHKIFAAAFEAVSSGESYYSPAIIESQRLLIKSNIDWDELDSKILLLLSKGTKTKDLPYYLDLSLSAIEKRKSNIKKQLIFEGGSDQQLLEIAKKLGLF